MTQRDVPESESISLVILGLFSDEPKTQKISQLDPVESQCININGVYYIYVCMCLMQYSAVPVIRHCKAGVGYACFRGRLNSCCGLVNNRTSLRSLTAVKLQGALMWVSVARVSRLGKWPG